MGRDHPMKEQEPGMDERQKEENRKEISVRKHQVLKETGIILSLGFLYMLFFDRFGIGIPCAFRMMTGWLCPGCGITRALNALLHGDIRSACVYNPLAVYMMPVLIPYLIWKTAEYIRTGTEHFSVPEVIFLSVLLIAATVFGIVRNIN
jgi:hypothetical protein